MGDVIQVLEAGPAPPPFQEFTVPEGLTLPEIAAKIAEQVPSFTVENVNAAIAVTIWRPPKLSALIFCIIWIMPRAPLPCVVGRKAAPVVVGHVAVFAGHAERRREEAHRRHELIDGDALHHLDVLEDLVRQQRPSAGVALRPDDRGTERHARSQPPHTVVFIDPSFMLISCALQITLRSRKGRDFAAQCVRPKHVTALTGRPPPPDRSSRYGKSPCPSPSS